jgi:hypothetical protein
MVGWHAAGSISFAHAPTRRLYGNTHWHFLRAAAGQAVVSFWETLIGCFHESFGT